MDINNKTLAILLIAGMVLSLSGTIVTISKYSPGVTGFATTGVVNYSIASTLDITVTDTTIDFGSGWVNGTENAVCVLRSTGANDASCVDFRDVDDSFTVQNIGNRNAVVDIKADKTAAAFLPGSSNANVEFIIDDAAENACIGTEAAKSNLLTTDTEICGNMTRVGNPSFDVDFDLTFDENISTSQTEEVLTITFTASDAGI